MGQLMSLFSFVVSNQPLPEINLTDTVTIKYGEYKKLNIPQAENSILNLINDKKDDLDILILDPLKMDYLRIMLCTNPPYGLEEYIQKPYTKIMTDLRYGQYGSGMVNNISIS
ncbi:hypothetical protein NV379_05015 [Paenibacillus sp. N1-5-1-14]|uniref:hypothetical protein n=1 Tax=Paenibacillus radicibacter TaxID=2972488 RepID=UPI002158AFF7|nr:hypothetical protein [Paenibacillus radicibacter]MCR8642011.1 hypothetical protein [Paenibacillus radicibacter]